MKKFLFLALLSATAVNAQATEQLKPVNTDVTAITQQAQTLVQIDMQTLSLDNKATAALLSLTKQLDNEAKAANPQRYVKSKFAANLVK